MEAAWLQDNKVSFEEVHVDLNQSEAERMVRKIGQMGVPVTEIQYDSGDEEFVLGFDKAKLSTLINS